MGRTKTVVASSVYNLAGDEASHVDVLKSTILTAVLLDRSRDLGMNVQEALRQGNGMKQKRFFSWAKTSAADWIPSAEIASTQTVSTQAVQSGVVGLIPLSAGQILRINSAVIDDPDITYWADDWMRTNRPEVSDDSWSVDFDEATTEIVISIGSEAPVRLAAPADFLWALAVPQTRRLLFVDYTVLNRSGGVVTPAGAALFIYRIGSGIVALDTLASHTALDPEFYPALPLRMNNKSIRDAGFEDHYAKAKKGFRRLIGNNFDAFLDTIEDNEQIEDIDFALLVQGVPLNVSSNVGKEYLFKFFQTLLDNQTTNPTSLAAYVASQGPIKQDELIANSWIAANATVNPNHPDYDTDAPSALGSVAGVAPEDTLRVFSESLPEYDFRLKWTSIDKSEHVGNAARFDGDQSRPLLKQGEYMVSSGSVIEEIIPILGLAPTGFTSTSFLHQRSPYAYTRITVRGLTHYNYVYANKAVAITAEDALADTEISGFLVPLHYPTFSKLGMRKMNQLANTSSYIVFNCYVQYKLKWYQTGIFKVILVIAAIVLPIIFPPAGGIAATGGVLGSNVAIGMALGATTLVAAAIIGSIANTIAAIVITTLISKASVAIFGEKLGQVIAAIASFMALQYGNQYSTHGNFDVDWGTIFRADNLLNLTNVVSDAYTSLLNADTLGMQEDMEAAKNDYETEVDKIQKLSQEILGMTNLEINPMMFTDATEYFEESRKTFTARTLLTGTDIAEISLAMIGDFVGTSLELPKAVL